MTSSSATRTSAVADRTPAQQRADSRQQLLVRERAADDVVGTAVEGTHALDGIGRRCEEDHRHVSIPGAPRLPAPQAQAEVELGEENDVGARALRELEGLAPARCAEDVEAVIA